MTKPDVVLNGQLAVATEEDKGGEQGDKKVEELSLPVYNLDIEATDIGTETNADKKKRSGVRKIEVKLDGVKKEAWEQPCSDSCSMKSTYVLKLNNLDADKHVLEVLATDGVGKVRERTIEFEFIPATGMKDEYVMQYFPLPDGSGNEAEEENPDRPELAVNVINGNLVYREKDIDVEGYGVDLEVERYYNSLLPEAENTEWGDGWTLAQTPDLQPEEGPGPAEEAMMVRSSGAVEGAIELPAATNEEVFDPELQAVVTKEADGGYEVADATGETDTSLAFDESGTVEELRTEGAASVDYDYDGSDLAEIEVDDPASTDIDPEQAAELAEIERTPSSFKYAFGLQGSADGQFKVATDVAIDPTDSTIWVADDENERVQHFSAEGAYIGKFTSCSDPGAVDIDLKGDIYVACSSANKIQKYDDKGTALKTIASSGTGNGQVRFPLDLALDPEQNLYVADTENSRVQKFNAAGTFVKAMPVDGRPWGVDVAPDGNIWTAEAPERRVSVFDPQGKLLLRFGSQGTGHSQFERPVDVEVDDSGFAWVTDAVNNRVQVFDSKGSYVTQFGEKGTGNGQLNTDWWLRVAVGPSGDVWVTDQGNSRLHKWRAAGRLRPGYGSKIQDDPEVEIESPGGLVESVEGDEAGEHIYEHEGDLLTSHEDADGETSYEYDGSGRMTRVDLPNGTWAKIEYGTTDGRVKKVTVAPGGTGEKSTLFTYTDKPRRTVVTLPSAPVVTYDIGEDGSVLKWQNALKPPEFEVIAGTLYDVANKETAAPINVGDYNLSVKAYSEEGIAKIEMYANGDQVISEKTCPQVYTEPAKCKKLPDEWVTYTGNHAPGILNLEMVIEDRIGQVAGKRFWVNIPYTPPPPPDQPATPKFADVLQFREQHGLDLDLDPIQDEFEINDRVFDTINDWVQGNPVAVASMERWGAPLRTAEVAELEWRELYVVHDIPVIDAWGRSTFPSSYAGAYIDERSGGLIRVGFTTNQASSVSQAKLVAGLIAPDRIAGFPVVPGFSMSSLETTRQQVLDMSSLPPALVVSAGVEVEPNRVAVGATNVAEASSLLKGSLGQQAPLLIELEEAPPEELMARKRASGQILAGDFLLTPSNRPCTAGFGAIQRRPDGKKQLFMLSAAHCGAVGQNMRRESAAGERASVGVIKRSGMGSGPGSLWADGEAVALNGSLSPPRYINRGRGAAIPVKESAVVPYAGKILCHTGYGTDPDGNGAKLCGPVRNGRYFKGKKGKNVLFCFDSKIRGGDSGGPVWINGSHTAVGLATNGRGSLGNETYKETCATALIPGELKAGEPMPPETAIMSNPQMTPLELIYAP